MGLDTPLSIGMLPRSMLFLQVAVLVVASVVVVVVAVVLDQEAPQCGLHSHIHGLSKPRQ